MVKKKPQRPDRNAYFRALVDETLQDLGLEIFHFRNLKTSLRESVFGKDIDPDVLFIIDGIYQSVLDNIFDGLANAKDLHVSDIAIDGLEKSLRVRRGFCKKADVL